MYQNPYNPQMSTQPNATASLSIVHGKEVALSYPSQLGAPAYFLDDSQPYLYKKRLDANGNVVEFRKFRLEEEIDERAVQIDPSKFATKDDINGIYNAIAELKNSMMQHPVPQRFNKKGNKDNYEPSTR